MINIIDKQYGAFLETLAVAKVGEHIIYARGDECNGHHKDDVLDAYRRGLVTLVQKKHGPSDYSYIAQKLDPKRRKR